MLLISGTKDGFSLPMREAGPDTRGVQAPRVPFFALENACADKAGCRMGPHDNLTSLTIRTVPLLFSEDAPLSKRYKFLALLVLATLALAACKGNGSTSQAPGGFPPVSPSGDHAQYVMATDAGATCGGTPALLTFSLGSAVTLASGNLTPFKNLTGAATKLNHPYSPFIDNNGNVWVANDNGAASVTEYSVTATGNTAPSRTIAGALTTFNDPSGVFVAQNTSGVNTWVFVTDYATNTIDIFPATASGNVAPTYQIAGVATGLNEPWGITLDSSGNIWVANFGGHNVLELPNPTSSTPGVYNTAPTVTIGGGTTTLGGPSDVYLDSHSDVWVADYSAKALDEFTLGSYASPYVRITSLAADPTGIAVDSGGNIYDVEYSAYINIWMANSFGPGVNAIGGSPTYSIAGPATKLACGTSVQVFSTGGTNDV